MKSESRLKLIYVDGNGHKWIKWTFVQILEF